MRVVETFGPTVQGEGPYAGRVCHFLRLGGCDYRCEWCDTMYAVEPRLVRQAPDLSDREVADRLAALGRAPMLVISGGNPALHTLDRLLDLVEPHYSVIACETQGSLFKQWLMRVTSLVVSPKPPSSGMATAKHWIGFCRFMQRTEGHLGRVLKLVVFDQHDLEWARSVRDTYPLAPLYLSAGTDVDADDEDVRELVAHRYRWLCEAVTAEPRLHGAVVLPQLHVIAWGHTVGV